MTWLMSTQRASSSVSMVDSQITKECEGMRGAKVLGGVYGIAATRRVLDLEGLSGIVGEVADVGYVPLCTR